MDTYLLQPPGTILLVLVAVSVFLAGPTRLRLVVAGALAVYTGAWLYYSPQGRYYLPASAVIAGLGGTVLARLAAGQTPARAALGAILVALVGTWLAGAAPYVGTTASVAWGFESKADYSERINGAYRAYRQLPDQAPGGTVALLGVPYVYDYPGQAIALAPPEFNALVPQEVFLSRLEAQGVRYVVFPQDYVFENPVPECFVHRGAAVAHEHWRPLAPFQASLTLEIYAVDGCYGAASAVRRPLRASSRALVRPIHRT